MALLALPIFSRLLSGYGTHADVFRSGYCVIPLLNPRLPASWIEGAHIFAHVKMDIIGW